MKKNNNNRQNRRGGARENSGRPIKTNKFEYVQVTCVLRRDTVEALRRGTGSKARRPQFGEFLQFHLDRHPLPTHEEYLYLTQNKPFTIKRRGRRVPVIMAGPNPARALPKRRPRPVDAAFEKALAAGR